MAGIEPDLAEALARAMKRLREENLFKPPGVSETLDWAESLKPLGAGELSPGIVNRTLGVILKYKDDLDRVRASGVEAPVG